MVIRQQQRPNDDATFEDVTYKNLLTMQKQTITTTKVGQLVHSPKKWMSFLVERGSIKTRNDEKHSFIFHAIDSSECFMAMSPEFCCAHKLHLSLMA